METQTWFGRHWKLLLNIVTLVALALLVYALRDQLVDTFNNLKHVNGWALLLLPLVEGLNYHAQTRLYQGLFKIVGNDLPYKFLFRTSLELNFVNHVFPSGGVTGISYFGLRLRHGKITGGKATLVQVMKLALTFLSFELVIIFGLLSLAVMGKASNFVVMVAAILSTLLVVGTVAFVYIIESRRRINAFFGTMTKVLNRVIYVLRPAHPETINTEKARHLFDDFHNNYKEIRRNYQALRGPFWYAFLANVTEVAAVYVVYLAFGQVVNIGAVIMAYAVANFAGLVSVLPGGIGVYEALMTAVLASAGIPAGVSLPVTVTYRVLNTLIQVPPGYYFYQKALRSGERVPKTSHKHG